VSERNIRAVPRTVSVAAAVLGMALLLIGVLGCAGGSTAARRRSTVVAGPTYFNTVRYVNVANAYQSPDYQLVDVDLRHVLLYNADSRAGKHRGLGRCSNLDYVSYIHCFNPTAKVLLYQDTFTSVQNNMADAGLRLPANEDATGCSTYASDVKHPDWFVHDSQGGEMVSWAFANTKSIDIRHLMDAGNPGYQNDCANQIIGTLRRYGFDGVFLDDNGWWGFYTWYDSLIGKKVWGSLGPQNGYAVKPYADSCLTVDPCSWMNALVSFNSYLAPRVRAATARSGEHPLVIGNSGDARPGGDYRAVIGPLDGFMEESWTDGGEGVAQQAPFWAAKAATAAWGAANGKYEMFHSWNDTESGNSLGLAATLLFADGKDSYSTSNSNYSGDDTWYPEYDSAEQLGPPTSSYTTSGPFTDCAKSPGVYYERHFRYGLVLVNPCPSAVSKVPLGGAYSGSVNEPQNVTSVALPPTTGYILIRSGSSSGPPRRAPDVSLSASARTLRRGAATTLTWTSNGATACDAPWASASSTAGAQKLAPSTSTVYAITCNAATGLGTVASVLVIVRGTPAPSPAVTITATPRVVAFGYGSIVSWTSTNATSCNATSPPRWSRSSDVSGSNRVSSLATATYAVTCTGAGRTASGHATVTVTPSPPVVVVGGSAGGLLPVVGAIRLQAGGAGAVNVVYKFDGQTLKSSTVHTDYFTTGLHSVEADVTLPNGKVIVRRRTLDVISP
jgi:hypothetical protein